MKVKVDYKEYINSVAWKAKRMSMLSDNVTCFCCDSAMWKYRIWECRHCGQTFPGDRYDYDPTCNCDFYITERDNDEYSYPSDFFKRLTNGSEYFQLHHVTYKNLGNEQEGDLKILCKDCHELAHHLIDIYPSLNIETVVYYIREEKQVNSLQGKYRWMRFI